MQQGENVKHILTCGENSNKFPIYFCLNKLKGLHDTLVPPRLLPSFFNRGMTLPVFTSPIFKRADSAT